VFRINGLTLSILPFLNYFHPRRRLRAARNQGLATGGACGKIAAVEGRETFSCAFARED
jgi:hypothetical protein